MPQYGMDRIYGIENNVEFPARFVSSIIQRDFKTSKDETVRFLANTVLGLGGMFDPAKKFLKIQPVNENMEQALAKWKVKAGPYLVVPVLNSATPRALAGRALDTALDPSCYMGTPVIAAVTKMTLAPSAIPFFISTFEVSYSITVSGRAVLKGIILI